MTQEKIDYDLCQDCRLKVDCKRRPLIYHSCNLIVRCCRQKWAIMLNLRH